MAADRASPLVSKKGPQFEVEYREFCFIGKPIGIVLSAFALVFGIILIIGGIEGRTNNLSLFHAQASWLIENAFELCIIAPALIVAVRGRKFLKPIFCGTLSVRKMIAVGISVGCATCYLSSILGETYFLSEKWNPAGLFNGFKGDLSLTAYLFGPFGEEMFYQVGIQTWLQRFGPFVAVIGTTALFWSVHLIGGLVPMTDALIWLLPGLLSNALIRQFRKSFGAALIAHSTYNVIVSIFILYPR